MKNVTKSITGLFSKPEPPNADLGHNIGLLTDVKALIESGFLSYYFRKTFVVAMEMIAYTLAILLALAGIWLFRELTNLFAAIDIAIATSNFASNSEIDVTTINAIRYTSYLFCFVPCMLALFWARVYTKSRRKINLLKQIEKTLVRVVANLSLLKAGQP